MDLVDLRTTLEFTSKLSGFFDGFASEDCRPHPPRVLVSSLVPPPLPSTSGGGAAADAVVLGAERTAEVACGPGGSASSGAADRCERHPLCSRGYKHGGKGGHCSLPEGVTTGARYGSAALGTMSAASAVQASSGDVEAAAGQLPLLKLKDWPPTKDFAELLPSHFDDLMGALPQPEYTRRQGALNLAARLPIYSLPPDLGPKMYVAYGTLGGGTEQPYGTTCLHMDMADAVNLMVHVQPSRAERAADGPVKDVADAEVEQGEGGKGGEADESSGGGGGSGGGGEGGGERGDGDGDCDSRTEGVHVPASEMSMDEQPADELETRALNEPTAGAIWDIWSAEDEPKLSAFLWRMAGDEERLVAHPIHDANVYVNAAMRQVGRPAPARRALAPALAPALAALSPRASIPAAGTALVG